MSDLIRAYLERVERNVKAVPIKLYPFMRSQPPRDQPCMVVIDPRVQFGRPFVSGQGLLEDDTGVLDHFAPSRVFGSNPRSEFLGCG